MANHLTYTRDGSGYYPVVHFNEFWLLRDRMVPMNDSVTNVTLHLEIGHCSLGWWQLMMQVREEGG